MQRWENTQTVAEHLESVKDYIEEQSNTIDHLENLSLKKDAILREQHTEIDKLTNEKRVAVEELDVKKNEITKLKSDV